MSLFELPADDSVSVSLTHFEDDNSTPSDPLVELWNMDPLLKPEAARPNDAVVDLTLDDDNDDDEDDEKQVGFKRYRAEIPSVIDLDQPQEPLSNTSAILDHCLELLRLQKIQELTKRPAKKSHIVAAMETLTSDSFLCQEPPSKKRLVWAQQEQAKSFMFEGQDVGR